MTSLTNAERETHLCMVAEDRSVWHVFSDDPVMIARMERIGAEIVRTVGEGKEFRMRDDQVVLRKGKRKVSEAQKQAFVERMHGASTVGDSDAPERAVAG